MSFTDHAAQFGLILDYAIDDGRWHRCKTVDKPRKRNGAYLWDGQRGVVRNWATMDGYASYRDEQLERLIPRRDFHAQWSQARERARERQEHLWADASIQAEDMLRRAIWTSQHPYLVRKGFEHEHGWVLDGELLVPMRDMKNAMQLNSVQRITEDGTKLFLAGGKAKGSVLKLGSDRADARWLVEGYATALSLREALRYSHVRYQVIVSFSAENLKHVASAIGRPAFVMADNDQSDVGRSVAEATGLPWIMPPEVGMDANDLHQREGLRELVKLIRSITRR